MHPFTLKIILFITVNGYTFRGSNSVIFIVASHDINQGHLIKERIISHCSNFFPLRADPISGRFHTVSKQTGSHIKQMQAQSAVSSASDPRAKGPSRFDTWSCRILLYLLPQIQEGQLSVTGGSMCMKYWLSA